MDQSFEHACSGDVYDALVNRLRCCCDCSKPAQKLLQPATLIISPILIESRLVQGLTILTEHTDVFQFSVALLFVGQQIYALSNLCHVLLLGIHGQSLRMECFHDDRWDIFWIAGQNKPDILPI